MIHIVQWCVLVTHSPLSVQYDAAQLKKLGFVLKSNP